MQVRGPGRLAIVGGVVRDALLYHTEQDPIQASKDLDLVLEGSCFELASNLQNTLGDLRVTDLRVHDQFGTVELVLDGVNIDLLQHGLRFIRHLDKIRLLTAVRWKGISVGGISQSMRWRWY